MSPRALVIVAAALALAWPRAAYAYRPFDGTDADTAELDTIELEIGPLQVTHAAGSSSYEPGFVFNYGFALGYEVVIDADGENIFDGSRAVSDVQVKHVLRDGVLQDGSGPSVALETGPLLPILPIRGADGTHDAGWDADLIVSYKWQPVTVHANFYGAVDRDRQLTGYVSTIVEGPEDWRLRPIAELLVLRHAGPTSYDEASALAGALWKLNGHVVFDGALRAGREGGVTEVQLRAGLTVAFGI